MSQETAAREIAALNRGFEQAYNSGDAAALVDLYFAPDENGPMASPPGGQTPVKGRTALVQMFTGMIPDMPKIRLESIDLVASDSVAFELGRAHLTTRDGEATMGRFTVCWIKTGLGWRAKVDFFAADGWA